MAHCHEMIVLDTCAIIWDALDASRLTPKAEKAIEQNAGELVICDISIWEIAMLIKTKRSTRSSPSNRIKRHINVVELMKY